MGVLKIVTDTQVRAVLHFGGVEQRNVNGSRWLPRKATVLLAVKFGFIKRCEDTYMLTESGREMFKICRERSRASKGILR